MPLTEEEMEERFPGCVMLLLVFAGETGPKVDIALHRAWLAIADKDRRKGVLMAALESIRQVGEQVLPEPEEWTEPTP